MVNKTSFIVINSSIVEYEFIIMSIHWEFIFDFLSFILYIQKIPKPKKNQHNRKQFCH